MKTSSIVAGSMWLRSELRAHWRSWIVLTVLVGGLGGAALSAAAGARRTDTALRRFVASSHTLGITIAPVFPGLAALRGVRAVDELVGEPLLRVSRRGLVDQRFPLPIASADGRVLYDSLRPVVRAGRLPSPDRPNEALATVEAAQQEHLHVGSRLVLRDLAGILRPGNLAAPVSVAPDQGTPVTITIVGIGVDYTDLAAASARSQGGTAAFGTIYLTPAYVHAHGGLRAAVYSGALVEVRPTVDLARLRRDLEALAARHPVGPGRSNFDISSLAEQIAVLQRAMHPDAVALWLFAVLVGLVSALLVGQALARQASTTTADFPVLRALGSTRRSFVLAATTPTLGIALVGGMTATAVAVVTSPLMPVGPARLAEPHTGTEVNFAVFGVGLVVIVALLIAQVGVTAWSATRPAGKGAAGRHSRLGAAALRAGLPTPAVAGIRLALEPGRGRHSVPVRSTMTGVGLALAAVVVALTFNVNLNRLNSSPQRYGWNWDLAVDGGYIPLPAGPVRARLARVPAVAAVTGGNYGSVIANGRLVPAVGLDQLEGRAFPTLLAGHPPRGAGEIVLGTSTLRQVRVGVGDAVNVQVGSVVHKLRVSGRAIFPDFERGGFTATDLGVGAATTSTLMHPTGIPPGVTYNFFLIKFTRGTSPDAAAADVRRTLGPLCARGTCNLFADRRPSEVNAYGQVAWTPLLLAGILAGLAVAALANAVASAVARRRRDLALLKTLGFTRRQLSTVVAWQATTLVVIALLVGVPAGVVAGHWLWGLFANQLGVAPDSLTPVVAVVVAVPSAVIVANVVAAVPGWAAGHVRPSRVLREE